jgi:hypothetical protein
MKLPRVQTKAEYIKFRGGLDLESPALSINPGALLKGMNYMSNPEGGYERIDGYERYDGRSSPSDATYYYVTYTATAGGPAVGETITGVDSGATGVVIVVGDGYLDYTKLSGTFTATEVINVGGVAKGTLTATSSAKGETTALLHATALNLAADAYRSDIAKPAGATAIRGLALLAGVLYAFVDDSTAAYGEIYKATAAGWVNVPLFSQISFTTGVSEPAEGATITQAVSGATALVKRVVLESGTWAGGDAAGRIIIGTIVGTFDATNTISVGATLKCTASSLATAIAITKGGRYEFVVYNFTGSTSTKRIYGCDGKNYGFEFDGTVYVPIHTGMTTDTPEYVAAFKNQLFFSFKGSSQNSSPGSPYAWSAVLGASEMAMGEDVTGYSVESETLLVISRNTANQLSGENADTFSLDPLDAEIGGIPRTIQSIGKTYCLDDRGIIQITRAQEFGNFSLATVSKKIQKLVNTMRSVVTASAVYRARNQYRLYGSDGTGICMTIGQGQYGLEYYFTEFLYPIYVSCTCCGEDSTGKDVVFFGATNGMVYQADKGSSFDGEDIEAYIWLPFNNSKSPTVLKSYRKATLEMTVVGYCSIRLSVEFSYGDTEIQTHITQTEDISSMLEIAGYGGYWDLSDWDSFYYDSRVVSSPVYDIAGDGTNISLIIYVKTDKDIGHKLDGAIIHYTPRRLVR